MLCSKRGGHRCGRDEYAQYGSVSRADDHRLCPRHSLWGTLSIDPYRKLKAAVAVGDTDEANANAKKIRTCVIIGIVVNVVIFPAQTVGRM